MHRREVLAGVAALGLAGRTSWAKAAPNALGLKGYIRTNWSQDPFSFGSYSYVAKGTGRKEYRELARPIGGRVFFAGEATHNRYNSTVHAAYETGVSAAKVVRKTAAQRIAVIGAGASGLAAAKRLSDDGRKVTVFEARERIGGRVWTSDTLGLPLDLGASWIHGVRGNPLTKLADALDLERMRTNDSYTVLGQEGALIVPSAPIDASEVQSAYGVDLKSLEPRMLEVDDGYSGHDVIFKGGYDEILNALEGDYILELGQILRNVVYTGDDVSLRFADGRSHRFDAVIITVPLGVLKRGTIAFDPPLPPAKRTVIERIGMGVLDKLYLRFEDKFWGDKTWLVTPRADLPLGQFTQWMNLEKYFREPILCAFNGGSAALELANVADEQVVATALETLSGAHP